MAVLLVLNTQISELQTQLTDHFETHPDADIYLSLPGLGVILGARVLGEFGTTRTDTPTPSVAKTTPPRRRSRWPRAGDEP